MPRTKPYESHEQNLAIKTKTEAYLVDLSSKYYGCKPKALLPSNFHITIVRIKKKIKINDISK